MTRVWQNSSKITVALPKKKKKLIQNKDIIKCIIINVFKQDRLLNRWKHWFKVRWTNRDRIVIEPVIIKLYFLILYIFNKKSTNNKKFNRGWISLSIRIYLVEYSILSIFGYWILRICVGVRLWYWTTSESIHWEAQHTFIGHHEMLDLGQISPFNHGLMTSAMIQLHIRSNMLIGPVKGLIFDRTDLVWVS